MKKIILFPVLALFLFSCSHPKKKSAAPRDAAFATYISGYTSGVISSASTIRIILTEDVAGVTPLQEADHKIFTFSPAIRGKAIWADAHTLEFRPEHPLPSGTQYKAEFHLSQVMDVPASLKTFPFAFQTLHQGVQVETGGLKSISEEDLSRQQLTGRLVTADVAQPDETEKILSATQNGKALKIRWSHAVNGTLHTFVIDSIRRTEQKGEVVLRWDGSVIGAKDKGRLTVEIPALSDFNLMNIKVNQADGQSIDLYFSDQVSKDQILAGLIYFKEGNPSLRPERHGNIIRVYPEKRIRGKRTLIVLNTIRNIQGYQLSQRYEQEVSFSGLKPAVEILGRGVILPSSTGLTLPFRAVSLKAVNVKVIRIYPKNIPQFLQVNRFDGNYEIKRVGRLILKKEIRLVSDKPVDYGAWNVFSLDLSTLIRTEPGAIYRIILSFDRSQSLYACGGKGPAGKTTETFTGKDNDREFSAYDGPGYNYYDDEWNYDNFVWRERDDPCKDSYYMVRSRQAARNVLASDLGIIAKSGRDHRLLVAVTSLIDTRPLAGADVEVYDYQHRLMATGKTDKEGLAEIPLKRKPFLVVASYNNQRGYLRVDDGSALSVSMFDVAGMKAPEGIKGFLYGARGVWRPGDTLFLTFMLEDGNHVLPQSHPVIFELFTPENRLYLRKVKTRSLNGVYDFRFSTAGDAPTGRWLGKVRVGDAVFTKALRIETVKPNRLKIVLDFGKKTLTRDGDNRGTLHVTWLHGALARNLKADVRLNLSPGKTVFPDYPGYTFDDPSKSFYADEQPVFEGRLDNEGTASFLPGIHVGREAPGMLRAVFRTRVYEPSGDFSEDRYSILYSPFTSYVGVKIPKGPGWNGALYSNETNLIPIVTVDAEGHPVDRTVTVEIYNVSWRWWWDRDATDNLASYVRQRSRNLIRTDHITTRNGKAMYEMKFDEEYWGRRLIRITDPVSGHSCGATFYLTYRGRWENATQEGPGGAEMLMFTTDKKSYRVGDKIRVSLPAFREGRALVTIETGSKILRHFWKSAGGRDSVLVLDATPEMTPNAYICVELIQPHSRTTNDRPVRMYGIQPVSVTDPATRLMPEITLPAKLEPEGTAKIRIKEKNGRAMTYTVAIVDEGLLDLTRFGTPDPWRHFYVKEALGIRTWDLYKYVMGAYAGKMAGLLSIGGDIYIEKEGKKNTNRFKPVVLFLGPYTLKAGKTATHTIRMPNYVGSVRAMVVASDGHGAYGSADKTVPVKKPLMVLATLPRMAGPGETVTLPVSVFAMEDNIRKVNVRVETNDMFMISGDKSQKILFDAPGDQLVFFTLKVPEKTGHGVVTVVATAGREEARDIIHLQVRAPNPRITNVTTGVAERGASWQGRYEAPGLAGTNTGMVEVSVLPPLRLEERLKYLITYPHGCVEQVTSSVFPQLYLERLVELSREQKDRIQANITQGIRKLTSFQVPGGGLTYWPGTAYDPDDWGTSYAGHFMLEARNKGYELPAGFLDNWLRYQQRRANSWSRQGNRDRWYGSELSQAYRLYTLALAGKPAAGAMNRLRETDHLPVSVKWRLAGAYLLAGKEEVARAMVRDIGISVKKYRELSWTYGSATRDEAMILEVLTLMNKKAQAKKIVDRLSAQLNSNAWMSTQTTAWSLLAIGKFAGVEGTSGKISFVCSVNGWKKKYTSFSPVVQIPLSFDTGKSGEITVENTAGRTLFTTITVSGVPAAGSEETAESNLMMSLAWSDMNGNRTDPASLEQGTDFYVDVTVHNPGMLGDYKDMVLTQLFASGWEIRNIRMENAQMPVMDKPRYQDIRDDRVYTYFDLKRNETKVFRIWLSATYPGHFYLPAVTCEAMYDNSIQAVRPGRWVEVVRQR